MASLISYKIYAHNYNRTKGYYLIVVSSGKYHFLAVLCAAWRWECGKMGGRIKCRKKQLDKESMKGTIYVLLSAVCFSTGGVLIKSIPWSSITIQGIRSIFHLC